MHVLSCKSSWGDGGVESVEALRLEGAPLSAALLTSFRFIDFELSSKTDKKKQYNSLFRTHSCMILTITTYGKHMIPGWNMYEKQDVMACSQLFV